MNRGIKQAGQSFLRRFGYEIRRVGAEKRPSEKRSHVDDLAALTVKESQFYTKWSAPHPLFSPWIGHPEFQKLYDGVAPHTIVSRDRCYMLVSFARYASYLQGDFAECGVYKGGTALLLCRVLKNAGIRASKKLYLFDSFKGLPKINTEKDQWFSQGQFDGVSVETVEKLLSDFQDIIDIRCGWIPQTFSGLENNRYAFVHLDVDLYQPVLDCCQYFYSRLTPCGVLLFDEYAFPAARGEKDAVDEFFADKPESPITLPTGQALVLKAPAEITTKIEYEAGTFEGLSRRDRPRDVSTRS